MESIRTSLHCYSPQIVSEANVTRYASVALLLRPGDDGPEVLFIQRASHPNDPWSGNLGFPGGRIDPEDSDPLAAAVRETAEEVGIILTPEQLLGQLDDYHGIRVPVLVSCYVFAVDKKQPIQANEEVERTFWMSLNTLRQVERHATRKVDWHGNLTEVPSIHIDEISPVLWGLTYRFIYRFFSIIGTPLAECTTEPIL